MHPYAAAIDTFLTRTVDRIFETLEGIPAEDLNGWQPPGHVHDINTFFGLTTHIVGAGEFWVLEAAGGIDQQRERLAEFSAEGSLDDLRARYDRWLSSTRELLRNMGEDALGEVYVREADPSQGMTAARFTRAECIVHALEHTALHLGHLQVQRQLWDDRTS